MNLFWGDFHCGTLSKWHLEIFFRIIKNDFIIVALDQWELRRQGWGSAGGGEVTLVEGIKELHTYSK